MCLDCSTKDGMMPGTRARELKLFFFFAIRTIIFSNIVCPIVESASTPSPKPIYPVYFVATHRETLSLCAYSYT